ncbi:MAG TPA: futalosine hydrolase [Vicinamibacterales bacterium]|nr:futalosine hydrolase [Vicinamibacterales bacterium]
MRILVVAATDAEVAPLAASLSPASACSLRLRSFTHAHHGVDILTTGVGMVATTAWCSGLFARERYDLAFNAGVCGSFRPALPPGAVVHVTTDRIADLGAEDGDAFLSVHDLQLLDEDAFPFTRGRLVNGAPPSNAVLEQLPIADAVTVNTAHGNADTIARVVERFNPHVETMEGAAFMYACLIHGVPFAQVRAVSNVVERRNRAAWKLKEAVTALNETLLAILDRE